MFFYFIQFDIEAGCTLKVDVKRIFRVLNLPAHLKLVETAFSCVLEAAAYLKLVKIAFSCVQAELSPLNIV